MAEVPVRELSRTTAGVLLRETERY